MLKQILVLLFAVAGCHADNPATPASRVYCGRIPSKILMCLDSPMFFKQYPEKCKSATVEECDKMKCVFTEIGWSVGNQVNKTKVAEYFDEFATEHPSWAPAVAHSKAACLGDHDLPAQGVFLNCAPYDIVHCAFASFLKKATPSQWKTTPECQAARDYAAACPICPADCFSPQVPYGSCNSCLSLPRSV